MKPTPGPYEIEWVDAQKVCINAPNGDPDLGHESWRGLAVFYGSDDDPKIGHKKAEANARLFIAAPDLLEALKAIVEGSSGFGKELPWHQINLDIARAAIAKAEGGEG